MLPRSEYRQLPSIRWTEWRNSRSGVLVHVATILHTLSTAVAAAVSTALHILKLQLPVRTGSKMLEYILASIR